LELFLQARISVIATKKEYVGAAELLTM